MRTRQEIAQFAIICLCLSIDAATIWANGLVNDQKSLRLFELARLLARCRCTQLAMRCRNWFSASAAAKTGQIEIATMMAKSSASITNSQLFSLAK